MGATKPKRPAKSGADMRAGAGDQGSDDGWTLSAASDFVPAKRGKPIKTSTRNKKMSKDKVAKSQYDIKKSTKASLKSRNSSRTPGHQVPLTAAALEQHNAAFEQQVAGPSFTCPTRTINGLEMSRLTDALDLQYSGPPVENFGDYKPDDFSDSSSVGGEPMMANSGRVSRPKKPKGAIPNSNGRVVGRKLVKWHRPRMAEKLLLHVQYECHRRNIALPWDKIVKRLSPGSSGFSALQHMNKLRDMLVTEGHMVPPLLGKKHVAQDPTIRGFVRDMDGELPNSTRVVRWGEDMEDRKYNLVVPGLVRGSGTYPRKGGTGETKTLETATKLEGQRRDRRPIELRDVPKAPLNSLTRGKPGPKPGSRNKKTREAELLAVATESFNNSNVRGGYGLRKTEPKSFKEVEDLDVDVDIDIDENTNDTSEPASEQREPSKRLTPPSTCSVILHLAPHLLSQFPKGTYQGSRPSVNQYNSDPGSGEYTPASEARSEASMNGQNAHQVDKPVRSNKQPRQQRIGAHQYPWPNNLASNGNGASYTPFNPNVSVFTALDSDFMPRASQHAAGVDAFGRGINQSQRPVVARRKSININEFDAVANYEGCDEHGTMVEYMDAIRHGEDPRINGLLYRNLSRDMQERAGIKTGYSHGSMQGQHSGNRGNDQVRQKVSVQRITQSKPEDCVVAEGIDPVSQISSQTYQSVSADAGSGTTSYISPGLRRSLDEIKRMSQDKSRIPQPDQAIHGPFYGGVAPHNMVSLMDIESGAAFQAQQRLARIEAETPIVVNNPDGTVETYKTWQSEEDFQQPVDTQMWENSNQYNPAGVLSPPATFDPYTQMSPPAFQGYYPSPYQTFSFDQSTAPSAAIEDHSPNTQLFSSFFTQSSYGPNQGQGSFRDVEGSNLFPFPSFQQPALSYQQPTSSFLVQGSHGFDDYMCSLGDDEFTHAHNMPSVNNGGGYQLFDSVMQSVEADGDVDVEPRMLETPSSTSSNVFPHVNPYYGTSNSIDFDWQQTHGGLDYEDGNVGGNEMNSEYQTLELQS